MSRLTGTVLAIIILVTTFGCGGNSGFVSPPPPPAAKGQLSVLPSSDILGPGGRRQFQAVLTNINGSVNWTVDEGAGGGTIDSNGLYTAPGETGKFHLTATSAADTSVQGKATIKVVSSGFTRAADMEVPRAGHTATLLRDGKVLLAGGDLSGTSAELFDPVSNSTTFTGSMEHSRSGHCAVLLDSGKVLVVGGADSVSAVASAELYDPATGTFSSVGNMTRPRWVPTATLLPGGKVLVVGGSDDSNEVQATAELFDPATNTFSATGNMNSPRVHFIAAALDDGRVLVAGGWTNFSPITALSSAEIYDPSTGNFTVTGEMTIIRAFHSVTNLGDGAVLILGGSSQDGLHDSVSSAEVYASKSGAFHSAGQLNGKRSFHTATLLPNGLVLVAGGTLEFTDDDGLPDRLVLSTVERFDPSSGKSVSTGGLEIPRFFHTATLLNDGRVLITGGFADTGETSAAVELDK